MTEKFCILREVLFASCQKYSFKLKHSMIIQTIKLLYFQISAYLKLVYAIYYNKRTLIIHCHEQLTKMGEQKCSQGRECYEALAALLAVLIEAVANQTLH